MISLRFRGGASGGNAAPRNDLSNLPGLQLNVTLQKLSRKSLFQRRCFAVTDTAFCVLEPSAGSKVKRAIPYSEVRGVYLQSGPQKGELRGCGAAALFNISTGQDIIVAAPPRPLRKAADLKELVDAVKTAKKRACGLRLPILDRPPEDDLVPLAFLDMDPKHKSKDGPKTVKDLQRMLTVSQDRFLVEEAERRQRKRAEREAAEGAEQLHAESLASLPSADYQPDATIAAEAAPPPVQEPAPP
eukprot:Hpha_TRINITY_DN24969_c0_g1::TRINITY_DN24969_c0_g1_i1::g.111155::m.111155